MADFTLPPGPWETDPHGTGEHGSVYDALGEQFLQTQPSPVYAGSPSEQIAYRKELARRLTAYPDLYEACRESQRLVAACVREGFTVAADVEALFAHNAVLSAAFKKAGG